MGNPLGLHLAAEGIGNIYGGIQSIRGEGFSNPYRETLVGGLRRIGVSDRVANALYDVGTLGAGYSCGRTIGRAMGRAANRRAAGGNADTPRNPYNVSTQRMTTAERQAVQSYARRTNNWIRENGPATVRSTRGTLRSQASAAARAERLRAARAGQPYQGQVGHVPDAALTGSPNPPAGWLDMPGTSNNVVGGGLGSRTGQIIDAITVDGRIP